MKSYNPGEGEAFGRNSRVPVGSRALGRQGAEVGELRK